MGHRLFNQVVHVCFAHGEACIVAPDQSPISQAHWFVEPFAGSRASSDYWRLRRKFIAAQFYEPADVDRLW
jgi:hypothetical protein